MDTAVSVELFVEILNRYVYYFDQQNEAVSISLLNHIRIFQDLVNAEIRSRQSI